MTGGGNEPLAPVESLNYMEFWCSVRCANKTTSVREIITYYDCSENSGYFVDFFNHSVVTDGHDTNCFSMNVDCRCDKDEWYLRYWAIFLSMFGAACILFKVILYTIHKITKQSRKSYEKRKIEAINATKVGRNGFDNAAFTLDNGTSPENSNDRLHKKLWLDVGSDANLR